MKHDVKVAIISDIHGNMEAFRAVLEDIDLCGIDDIICLGDTIGYGAEPNEVIYLLRERRIATIIGNHEVAAIDRKRLSWFNPTARLSLEMTFQKLSETSLNFIAELKTSLIRYGCRFVHGFPPDSQTIYLFQASEKKLQSTFRKMTENVCFVGHTHELKAIGFDGMYVEHIPLFKTVVNLKSGKYIVNVGSVGQPRDGNRDAKYVIWNTSDKHIEVRFVSYDMAAAADKIIKAGLPHTHAERLWR